MINRTCNPEEVWNITRLWTEMRQYRERRAREKWCAIQRHKHIPKKNTPTNHRYTDAQIYIDRHNTGAHTHTHEHTLQAIADTGHLHHWLCCQWQWMEPEHNRNTHAHARTHTLSHTYTHVNHTYTHMRPHLHYLLCFQWHRMEPQHNDDQKLREREHDGEREECDEEHVQ